MVQTNIISDMCNITRVPNKIMTTLINKENLCIGSAVHDAILNKEDVAVLNIGIGTLSIEIATKQCKFIPSRELKNIIKKSIDEKIDPLELELDTAIVEKLVHICSEAI